MISDDKITEIFCLIDEFCKEFDSNVKKHLLAPDSSKASRNKSCRMSDSEIITILILFHRMNFRNLKHFYLFYVCKHLKSEFPQTVSYNRFVELQQKALFPMVLFTKMCLLGNCTGISFVDSTPIKVCTNKRIKRNKVFNGIATVGKSTIGWFFGFKLHIAVNEKGEILSFVITQANVDDRAPLSSENFLSKLFGKLYADKGYISQALTEMLFQDGIHLITGIRNKMKNSLMSMYDKIMLRKRSIIETINDELKNICQVEHSRHRSFPNFISNLISGIAAYCFLEKKPAIRYEVVKTNQLQIF